MSVILNILNALEKNKRKTLNKKQLVSIPIIPATKKQQGLLSWKLFYWLIVLAIPIGTLWTFFPQIIVNLPRSLNSYVTINLSKYMHDTPTNKKVLPAPLPTIKLQDITLEQKNNKTILNFIISAPTSYHIEYGAEQKLLITLNNIGVAGNLPLALDNSFITSFNTTQNNNNIVSTLTLLPGTKVDAFQLVDKPNARLHLVLSNSQVNKGTITKTPAPLSPEEEAAACYQEIKQLIAQGKIQAAIPKMHMFIGDFPNNNEIRSLLVSILIKEERLEKADDVLMAGLDRHHDHLPFIKLKANILIKQNKALAAMEFLQKHATAAAANDIEYLALLAALYQQDGDCMSAAELYNQLTKIQPQKAAWWVGLGIALEHAGKKNAAKEAYHRAYNAPEISPELKSFLDRRR